jgi:hypothetical protein
MITFNNFKIVLDNFYPIKISDNKISNYIIDDSHILNLPKYYNYHIGNWLTTINNLLKIIPNDKIKIWEYTDLNRLLSYLDCKIEVNIPMNTSEHKKFVKEYLNAYDNLSKDTIDKIHNYLNDDVLIWNYLIQFNNKYFSIFDRLPDPILSEFTSSIIDNISRTNDEKIDITHKVKHNKLI